MCLEPIKVYENKITGEYKHFNHFNPLTCAGYDKFILVPCGHCVGCLEDYKNSVKFRGLVELAEHEGKALFITFTVAPEHIEEVFPNMELQHRPFQLFMKRLRRYLDKKYKDNFEDKPTLSYLMCGEYGAEKNRPHYHAIIFGLELDDMYEFGSDPTSKFKCFRSPTIEKLWPFGFTQIGYVTEGGIGYLTKYIIKKKIDPDFYRTQIECIKKIKLDDNSFKEYIGKKFFDARVDQETGEIVPFKGAYIIFPRGKNGGLGYRYFLKNYKKIFKQGYVTLPNGCKIAIPTYFKRKCKEMFPEIYTEWQEKAIEKQLEIDKEILENNPELKVSPVDLVKEMLPGIKSVDALDILTNPEDESFTSTQIKAIKMQAVALTTINLTFYKLQQYTIKKEQREKMIQVLEIKKQLKRKKFLTNF